MLLTDKEEKAQVITWSDLNAQVQHPKWGSMDLNGIEYRMALTHWPLGDVAVI